MSEITYVLSYYNQQEALRLHLAHWRQYPEAVVRRLSFLVVDDCSQQSALEVLQEEIYPSCLDITLLRVKQDLFCNIAGVRNLGLQQLRTKWALLLDMDTLVNEKMAGQLLQLVNNSSRKTAYRFNRMFPAYMEEAGENKLHPAVTLIRRKDYWRIGGCEEDLVGNYGCTDKAFWMRAMDKVRVVPCEDIYLIHEPTGMCEMERDTSKNRWLLDQRVQSGLWSTDYVRFEWERVPI